MIVVLYLDNFPKVWYIKIRTKKSVIEERVMTRKHEQVAQRLARKLGTEYDPKRSPDIRAKNVRIEVKSEACEIPKAIEQLGGGQLKKKYVCLPKNEHENAKRLLKGSGIGLLDYRGNCTKRPRRK